jgi:ketosteroid isomerase-like protein
MKALATLLLALATAVPTQALSHDALCAELVAAEQQFCALVATEGIADAFVANMAPDVFLPDQLQVSRAEHVAALRAARAKAGGGHPGQPDPNVQLTWSPLKVDVSADGTLGYTWGKYRYTSRDKAGKVSDLVGIYLTIWKRQPDGSWKYVFDGSPQLPDDPKALTAFLERPDLPQPPK